MKKFLLFAICSFSMANAQVPNPGFEETISDGFTLKNWGAFFPIPFSFDLQTGTMISDEIIFQNGVGFSSPAGNCVTGSWAMMLTNAFNATTNKVIPGKASLFNDAESETHTGWNNGIPVAAGAEINRIGFDYQFFPAGDTDVVEAVIELFGESGERVGRAELTFANFEANFTYVYAPIQFTSPETPVFMTIEFNMAKEGSTPTFGSMFFVDNVVVNSTQLGNNTGNRNLFTVFPTAASNEINVVKNSTTVQNHFDFAIIDANGKMVKKQSVELTDSSVAIDVSDLSAGVYFLKATSEGASNATRFIKK